MEAMKRPDFSRFTPPQLLVTVLQELIRLSSTVEVLSDQMDQKGYIANANANGIAPEQASDRSA